MGAGCLAASLNPNYPQALTSGTGWGDNEASVASRLDSVSPASQGRLQK